VSDSDMLAAQLAPYRQTPGISAALLISRDGFVVASDADPDFKADAMAAQAGGIIDIAARLAVELRQDAARYITVELDDITVLLAPFGPELMLALVGTRDVLSCDYRLKTTGA
jgi:uncharacterized protein